MRTLTIHRLQSRLILAVLAPAICACAVILPLAQFANLPPAALGYVVFFTMVASVVASMVLVQRQLDRIRQLNTNAMHLERRPPLVNSAETVRDELLSLELALDRYKTRLLEAVNREQFATSLVSDSPLNEAAEKSRYQTASELRTAALMDQLPAALLLIDAAGSITFSNASAARMFGHTPEQLRGLVFLDFLAESSGRPRGDLPQSLRATDRSVICTIRGTDGEKRVELWINEFGNQDGRSQFLAMMSDCTDDQRFKELQQRLVAMIAHDIATPLTTVHGILEMASEGVFGRFDTQLERELAQRVADCNNIITQFKNVVRFEKFVLSSSSIAESQCTLGQLTSEAVHAVQPLAIQKSVVIRSNVVKESAARGIADQLTLLSAKLLQLVVQNVNEGTEIDLLSEEAPDAVRWIVAVSEKTDIPASLQPFLQPQTFAPSDDDLELILWQLMLSQSAAHVSAKSSRGAWTITLDLPRAKP